MSDQTLDGAVVLGGGEPVDGTVGVTGDFGYRTEVEVRWSDMDAFQHINHARMVTLLEEARIPFLFADDAPTAALREGAVITELTVKYQGQLRHADTPLEVTMWTERVRAADFTLGYEVRGARQPRDSRPAIVASTQIASFDIAGQRLRRLTSDERAYLKGFSRA